MARKTWVGKSSPIQQVDTLTVGSSTNGHTFVIALKHPSGQGSAVTMGTYVAGAGETTTTIANAIYYMLTTGSSSGSSGTGAAATLTYKHPWVTALSFSQSGAVITVTANVAGVPFVFSNSGTGTLTRANSTPNSGPNDYSVAGNWGEGSVPGNGDILTIQGSSSILYGLAPTATTSSITIRGFTGAIGWPEYPLDVYASSSWVIDSAGSGIMNLAISPSMTATSVALCQIFNIGGQSPYGLYITPVLTNAGANGGITLAQVFGGSVLFHSYSGDDSSIATLEVAGGARADIGYNNAAITINVNDGNVHVLPVATAPTTLNLVRGEFVIDGALAMATANINGGRFVPNSTGTITTLNQNGGATDFTQSRKARTVSTLALAQAGEVTFDTAYLTVTTFTRTGPFKYASPIDGRAA